MSCRKRIRTEDGPVFHTIFWRAREPVGIQLWSSSRTPQSIELVDNTLGLDPLGEIRRDSFP